MLNGNTNPRMGGVVASSPNTDRSAPVKTVTHCAPMEMFAVELGDEQGVKHTTVIFKVGNQFYTDPQGEAWAARLRPIEGGTWLGKQLLDATKAPEGGRAAVPRRDTVDVLGGVG